MARMMKRVFPLPQYRQYLQYRHGGHKPSKR
jgi:hypothetical protein